MNNVKETTSLYDLIAASIVNGALPRDFSLPKPQGADGELFFADGAVDGIGMRERVSLAVKEQ